VTLSQLWRGHGFRLGLALRLLAVFLLVPQVQQAWFVPFVRHAIAMPGLDPWTSFLNAGGDPLAFPYGIAMLAYHLPFVALGMLAENLTGLGGLAQTGFALSLMTADLLLLVTLCRMDRDNTRQLVLFYWLSPITLYVSFWHGQTDVIVMLVIVLSLLLVRGRNWAMAGASYAVALSVKLSAVIPLPFLLLFLWKNRRNREGLPQFLIASALTSAILQLPLLLSSGYRAMVLGSPEISRVYDLTISLSADVNIYVVPALYLLLLYWAWQIGRMNFQMLLAFLGVSYFLILLATPAAVGWYLWVMPFLAIYQIISSRGQRILIAAFSLIFVAMKLLTASGASVPLLGWDLHAPMLAALASYLPERSLSLAMSALTATGLVICVTMVQRALRNNDFYRLSRQPLLLGIAGDSGTGKDTLSASLAGLFGDHSVASVSGDDYHRFERSSPMWQTLTHLDPRANDLNAFATDCMALVEGKHIRCRIYDHTTGRFSRQHTRTANDVVLASGLHALYQDTLRSRMNLRIFLDMDEELRRYLKLRRDVEQRGHSLEAVEASMERRRRDFEHYLQPQMTHADVLFSLRPSCTLAQLPPKSEMPLALTITLHTSMDSDALVRALVGLCGLTAEILPASAQSATRIFIEGDFSAADARAVGALLVPHIDELLDAEPIWQGGMTGIMQVVILMLIAEQARKRN
jgi:uridine kinase